MTIYGECIGARDRTPVTISALGNRDCEIEPQSGSNAIVGLFELWIGAIGPLQVVAENSGGPRCLARFREPLDERIIAHFASA
jgi:hypothetical protein